MSLHETDLLETEQRNERSAELDLMDTLDILRCMNEEDQTVPAAVARCLPVIAEAVSLLLNALQKGGRIFYVGAGTSGRLGILDAYECPPTFGTKPELFQAFIAGGSDRQQADEAAEDREDLGARDLTTRSVGPGDVVVGIAASGRTPYVIGALRLAREVGARTVSISCNRDAAVSRLADAAIEVPVGPEVVTGSTRLKAGTAQKMVLNMLSTAAMVKSGKVFGNLMVDLTVSNEKLQRRAQRIVAQSTGISIEEATKVLRLAGNDVKAAIVMLLAEVEPDHAAELLRRSGGHVRSALRLAEPVNGEEGEGVR